MEVKAKLRHYHAAPRKIRLVIDVIRGLDIDKALAQLQYINKRPVIAVTKLLNSAIANAVNNFSLKRDNLYIRKAFVDQGPALKRWRPRAHGRAARIRKFTSHVTLILDEKIESKKKKPSLTKTKDDKKEIETKKVNIKDVKKVKKIDKKTMKKIGEHMGQRSKSQFKQFMRKTGDK